METMMTNTTGYLVTPKPILKQFVLEADRAYFAKPVVVELLYSELGTKHLFVRDPQRGHVYPINRRHLVPFWALTNKQKAAL
jgi:hypothetical protein